MNRLFPLAVLIVSACSDPLVGTWESYSGDDDYPNVLVVEEDYTGTATFYFSYEGDNYSADFTHTAQEEGEDLYTIDFVAVDEDASALDHEQTCDMDDDGERMDCEGSGLWSEYIFEWYKVDGGGEDSDASDSAAICSEGETQCGDEDGSGNNNIFECVDGQWERAYDCGWYATCVSTGSSVTCL